MNCRVSHLRLAGFGLLLLLAACSSSEKKPAKEIIKAPSLAEEELLENAQTAYDKGLFSVALQSWTELRDGYPASFYTTLAELKVADSQFFSGDYPAALASYEEFAKMHPGHEAMSYVRYQIANCHLQQYKDELHDQAPLRAAIKAFEELVREFPNSEFVVLARRRLTKCRELQATYEATVAEFYNRRGLSDATLARIHTLVMEYPGSAALKKLQADMDSNVLSFAQETIDDTKRPNPEAKAPKPPQVIADRNAITADGYEARLARLRPESVASEDLLAKEIQPPAPAQPAAQTPALVNSVSCEEQPGAAIFLVNLSQPVSEEKRSTISDSAEEITFTVPSRLAPEISGEKACRVAGGQLEIVGVKVNGDSTKLTVRIEHPQLSSQQLLLLDRPARILLVIPIS